MRRAASVIRIPRRRRVRLTALTLGLAALTGGIAAALPSPALASIQIANSGQIVVHGAGAAATIDRHPFHLSFQDRSGRTVLSQVANSGAGPTVAPPDAHPPPLGTSSSPGTTLYAPFAFLVGAQASTTQPGGEWSGNQLAGLSGGVLYSARDVLAATPAGDGVKLTLSTSDPSGRQLLVTVTPGPPGTIRVSAAPSSSLGVSTMADSFASGPDEAFHGFGGRHNALDQHGQDFYNWVEQENVGAGYFEPGYTQLAGSSGHGYLFPNGPTAAYYVQSLFVSSRPYGFLLDRTDLSRFRLDSDRPDAWQVAVAAPQIDYLVAPGDAPRAIATLNSINGRQPVPPAWAAGTLFDREARALGNENQQTYSAAVDSDIANIVRYHIPVNGYRLEGWGLLTTQQVREKIDALHQHGIHALVYFRPFVADDTAGTEDPNAYSYAVSHGYVATTAPGQPYLFEGNFPGAPAALIDFTNPAAVQWWDSRIRAALDLGADGFMQDFGEQVQPDMHFADGETGATMHNRYSVLYHQVTRQVLDAYQREHPGRQLFFFTRSGYSGTPGSTAYESSNFPGDENTDFGRAAGLASLASDMLNRAIGGAYGYNTDIGGYNDFNTPTTTKELFIRWAEWAALSPFFRLHGAASAGTHTPWSFDQQTVDVYRQLSDLHLQAEPLLLRLWTEAETTGMPPTRPLWLAYPGDTEAGRQDQEWMLGPDVLVAPVVDQGATSRAVYFPAGCWLAPDTGEIHHGPATATVPAPLTRLPYFFACGTQPFVPPPAPGQLAARSPACASRRHFRIHLRHPPGQPLAVARVYVNGHRVRVIRGRRLHATVDLRGLARGTFRVRIIARTRGGRVLRSTRTYHACVPGRHHRRHARRRLR